MSEGEKYTHFKQKEDKSLFETGDFSARYIKKNTREPDETGTESEEPEEPNVGATRPISFNKIDPKSLVDEYASLGRRESLLSASISKSFSLHNTQLAGSPAISQSVETSRQTMPSSNQMAKIVGRHLSTAGSVDDNSLEPAGTNYSSMKKVSGFLTRDIENWVHERNDAPLRRTLSSGSLDVESRRSTDLPDARDLTLPNGFRRNFIENQNKRMRRSGYARSFFEFLSLYGHFAGEDLREDDSELESESEFEEEDGESEEVMTNDELDDDHRVRLLDGMNRPSFNNLTLRVQQLRKVKTKTKVPKKGKASTLKAFLLLLKAFLGTGIIFLPKAFSNGGLLFCNGTIILFSLISYYCFVVLINTTKELGVSGYGDAGFKIYGNWIRTLILLSLVLSQMGFASSYVVFVGSNLRELYNLIMKAELPINEFILFQLVLFLPLSLTRKISKLGFFALIADVFIFMGLIYIYSESTFHLIEEGVSPKIQYFNSESWPLFIGTAVFAYEGIGLLIPIQESMKEPEKFNKLLVLVMVIVTIVFTSLASLAYLSYGDDVKTVILMNFPHNTLTVTIQLCYSIAILLSTPLQIFPAIKIVEQYLFHKDRSTWKGKIRRNSEAVSMDVASYGSISSPASQQLNPNLINQDGLLSGKSDMFIKTMKNVLRVTIILVMTTIGYLGSNHLDKFVSLVGSFTCIPLIYIYPPMMYVGCFRDNISLLNRIICSVIFLVGCTLMAYTSYDTVRNW